MFVLEYRDPPTSEIKDNFKNNEDFPKFLPPSTVLRRVSVLGNQIFIVCDEIKHMKYNFV